MGRLVNYAISIITTIVTLVTAIGFIISPAWKMWAKTHSEWVFYAFIVLLLAAAVSLNYFYQEKKEQSKKYQQLNEKYRQLVAAQAKPSENDMKLFRDLITTLPPDGEVIVGMKESFAPDAFRREHHKVIEAALKKMKARGLGFDNSRVEAGYTQLREALQEFEDVTSRHLRGQPGGPWLQIRTELSGAELASALGNINGVRLRLVEKYTSFLEVAHQSGIDW